MGIGKRIGLICQEEGISLRQLAIKAKIPYSTLYSAVKRDSNGIDSEALKRIAEALDVDLVSLLMSDDDLAELLPSDSEIDEYLSDVIAQNKINVFKQAAYLAGYEVNLSKSPYSMKLVPQPGCAPGEGEVVVTGLTNEEIANAVNQLIFYAGTLCFKMTDAYKRYKTLVGEPAADQLLFQTKSNLSSAAPNSVQDTGSELNRDVPSPSNDKDTTGK